MANERHGILFLCVANSSRSQMAEGLARSMDVPGLEVASAGSVPTGVNPFAVQAMREVDIDISKHSSTSVGDVDPSTVQTVITLCAEEVCPVFLGDAARHHFPFEDPAAVEGTDEEKLASFRKIRKKIRTKLESFFRYKGWT